MEEYPRQKEQQVQRLCGWKEVVVFKEMKQEWYVWSKQSDRERNTGHIRPWEPHGGFSPPSA